MRRCDKLRDIDTCPRLSELRGVELSKLCVGVPAFMVVGVELIVQSPCERNAIFVKDSELGVVRPIVEMVRDEVFVFTRNDTSPAIDGEDFTLPVAHPRVLAKTLLPIDPFLRIEVSTPGRMLLLLGRDGESMQTAAQSTFHAPLRLDEV